MSGWDVDVSDGHCDICGESTAVATIISVSVGEDVGYEVALCRACLQRALDAIEVHKENNW